MDVNKFCQEIASPRIRHFVQNRIKDSSHKRHFVKAYEIIVSMFPQCDVYSSRQEEGKETYWHTYFGVNPFKNAKDGKGTPCITLTKFKEGVVLWEGGADKSTINKISYHGNDATLKKWLNSLNATKNNQMMGSGHRFNFYHDPYQLKANGASSVDTNTTVSSPLNQILYGPPGTGKTYHTVQVAVKAADPDFYAELAIDESAGVTIEQRKMLIAQYQLLLDTKQVRFVTFHQSYGYEEFVEGLKAKTDNGHVRYDVEPGIFRQLVESAKPKRISDKNTTHSSYELEKRKIWKMSLGNTLTEEGETVYKECLENDYILLGYGDDIDFSGCNDTAKIKKKYTEAGYTLKPQDYNVTAVNTLVNKMRVGDLVVVSDGNYKFKAIAEVTSDYKYLADDREDFFQKRDVKWLLTFEEPRPVDELCSSNLSQMTLYHLKDSVISREKLSGLLNKTRDEIESIKNHVLIIDEINRGNISKIFGELITLIEPSKRLGFDKNGKINEEALTVTLPHSGKPFSVPDNLYLIGTMNTADRSLAMMDTALRRRFDFVEMMPKPKLLKGKAVKGIDLERLLEAMNERIEVLYDREHTLGHAFFMPVVDLRDGNEEKGVEADEQAAFEMLQQVFKNKIIPLLEEYFFEDWNKIRLVLGDNRKKSDALSQYVFIQQHTASYNDIFGEGHGLETYEDKKTTYKLTDFNDENSAWQLPLAYQAIYDATILKKVDKPSNSDNEPETSSQ